ncbi:MAG: hypothetical protein JWQ98_593 [Chlorobi bacterium]|nr:hypothetical protein [Chlorobiota bacterium]
MRILAIDIGGSGLKAAVLDEQGTMLVDRVRVETPHPCWPDRMVEMLEELVTPLAPFDRVAVGFPGVVRDGVILTAPNLGTEEFRGCNLQMALEKRLGKPVRVLNDADLQGLAAIEGKGVEMVITLGTGMGSALFLNGHLAPHLELAHHPFRKGETYDEQLGNAALKRHGHKKWNRRVRKAIDLLRVLTNFDHLYIGGGNGEEIDFDLESNITIVPNEDGLRGGIWLWRERPVLKEAPRQSARSKARSQSAEES